MNGAPILKFSAPASSLTERELQIARLICEGLTGQQIAARIFRSWKTVDKHRTNLYAKLDVHNGVQLVRWMIRNGLFDA